MDFAPFVTFYAPFVAEIIDNILKGDFGGDFQGGKIKCDFGENSKITQPISRVILGVIFKGVKSSVIFEKTQKSHNQYQG